MGSVGSSGGAGVIIATVFVVTVLVTLAFFVGPDFLGYIRKTRGKGDDRDGSDSQ